MVIRKVLIKNHFHLWVRFIHYPQLPALATNFLFTSMFLFRGRKIDSRVFSICRNAYFQALYMETIQKQALAGKSFLASLWTFVPVDQDIVSWMFLIAHRFGSAPVFERFPMFYKSWAMKESLNSSIKSKLVNYLLMLHEKGRLSLTANINIFWWSWVSSKGTSDPLFTWIFRWVEKLLSEIGERTWALQNTYDWALTSLLP